MHRPIAAVLFCATLSMPTLSVGQAKPDAAPTTGEVQEKSYRLTFVVRELVGGKEAGTRAYSSLLADNHEGGESIRSGSKVPIAPGAQAETQYLDIGANFDFRIPAPEHGLIIGSNQLPLVIGADVSSIAKEGATPVIRQNRWRSSCLLTLGKPTLIFSSEDPTLDRTTQVELTVIRLPPTGAQ